MTKTTTRPNTSIDCGSKGGTVQPEHDHTNINNILAQYRSTGSIVHTTRQTPLYGDFSDSQDLQTQLDRVHQAQDHFAALPASVRALCDHDPTRFLELMTTEDGIAGLESAGLNIGETDAETPQSEPPTPDPAQDPPSEPDAS